MCLPQPDTGWKVAVSRSGEHLIARITPPKTVKIPPVAWPEAWIFPLKTHIIDLAACKA
jgi:hypothetical protein